MHNIEKSCCFTGHRPQNLPCGFNENHPACISIKEQLRERILELIEEKGVTHFISGAALGVDMWAMEIVIDIKKTYKNITLEAAIPCRGQSAKWNIKERWRYSRLLDKCDEVNFIQKDYTSDCMMKRNKYMVDNSAYIIAVWNGRPSGTGKTVKYAKEKGREIYCIVLS